MDLSTLQAEWTRLGATDPFWAVLSNAGTRGGKWDVNEFFRTGEKDVQHALGVLAELRVTVPRGTALDFGCGVGRLSQALARQFEMVVGVDIAPSMVATATELARDIRGCSFVVNGRDDLSRFDTESFDFVFSHIVLQHMEPRYALAYIGEFTRVLRPGGAMVFQVLVPHGPYRVLNWAKRHAAGAFGLLRRLRDPNSPIIELYGIPEHQITDALRRGGVVIAATRDDPNGGRGTRGLVVYAYKPV